MDASHAEPEWEVIGCSRRGTTHHRTSLPNQDALQEDLFDGPDGPTVCLAVADGHGSKRTFRSDRGAGFSVRAARDTLRAFSTGFEQGQSLSDIGHTAAV